MNSILGYAYGGRKCIHAGKGKVAPVSWNGELCHEYAGKKLPISRMTVADNFGRELQRHGATKNRQVECPMRLHASKSNHRRAAGIVVCLALCMSVPHRALAQSNATPSPTPLSHPKSSPSGLVVSAGFGFGVAFGRYYSPPDDWTTSPLLTWFDPHVDETVSSQLPFSLGLAHRPIPLLSFGVAAELAKVPVGAAFHLGGDVRFHFRTDHPFSPWTSVGFGYELLHFETQGGSGRLEGYGIDLQAGGDFRGGRNWTIGPYVGLRVGTYTHMKSYGSWRGASPQSVDIPYENRALHEWLMFGMRGTFASHPQ